MALNRGKRIAIFSILLSTSMAGSCSQEDQYNSDAQKKADQSSALRDQQLDSVAGRYCGTVHLDEDSRDFAVNLNLSRADDNVHSSNTQDPTQVVQVPKLAGTLEFVDLRNLGDSAYDSDPDLMKAAGKHSSVAIDEGDYSVNTGAITLPYNIPEHPQGTFGELRGEIADGVFSGTWLSNGLQNVGTFNLKTCTKPISAPSPSPTPTPSGESST